MYDELKALELIGGLPDDVRLHLRHVYRNGLQNISIAIESADPKGALEEVMRFSEDLRRMGL